MAVTQETTPIDSRLGRAGELAAHLRANPRETRRDPDDLAREFGVDPAVASQLQITYRVAARTQFDWRPILARLGAVFGRLLALPPKNPYLFLLAAAGVSVGLAVAPWAPSWSPFLVWFGAETWCLIARPQSRHVLFASLLVWIGAWYASYRYGLGSIDAEQARIVGGKAVLALIIGWGTGFMNFLVGSLLLVAAGWIRIAAHRRSEARQTRQDLLSRLFLLQKRLETLPPKPTKPAYPLVRWVQGRLFLATAATMFVIGLLGTVSMLVFHVDAGQLYESQGTVISTSHTKVTVAAFPGGFMVAQQLLSLLKLAAQVWFALLATSRRKVRNVCLGLVLGQILSGAVSVPLGSAANFGPAILGITLVSEIVSSLVLIMIVRAFISFNRVLKPYINGESADEAAIVSELLEIRHRLSAISVQVYVLVVDAAGSTAMKRGADPLEVEFSFGRYQAWIAETVSANGGKVEMGTGDGAICAFGDAADALQAARKLQIDVTRFNTEVNRLELPFRLRISLHAGRVVADLDKVQFTEVIDVAAHVEKYSPVGGLAMTETFFAAANGKESEIPSNLPVSASVDGLEVFAVAPDYFTPERFAPTQ